VRTVSSPSFRSSLSLQQRHYRANRDAFLSVLRGRAERLFEDGYRVEAAAMPCVFVVRHSARGSDPRDAACRYLVHAVKGSCTCPFFTKQRVEPLTDDGSIIPCKHLLGLEELVRLCSGLAKASGDLHGYYKLLGHWMRVLAERHHPHLSLSGMKGSKQ
jgi:hypothetical protein